jgi:hypothetical protein
MMTKEKEKNSFCSAFNTFRWQEGKLPCGDNDCYAM